MKHHAYQKHSPNNFAYYVKYCNEEFKPPAEYSGKDVAIVLYKKIKKIHFTLQKSTRIKLFL